MDEYGRIHTDGSRSGGQPVVATQKAHTMVREVLAEWGIEPRSTTPAQLTIATTEALCRAIEQREDLRVEAKAQFDRGYYEGCANPIVRHDALREALEAAPIINLWESKEDFRRRQDGWLKTKYRAALEQSK